MEVLGTAHGAVVVITVPLLVDRTIKCMCGCYFSIYYDMFVLPSVVALTIGVLVDCVTDTPAWVFNRNMFEYTDCSKLVLYFH